MTVKPVLQVAANLLETVFADQTKGFNPALADACNQYGQNPFVIDFGDATANFWRSPFDVADIYDSEGMELPGLALYEAGDQNTNLITSGTFSGPMRFQLDAHLSWQAEEAKLFERMRYAVHDAVINVLNGDFAQTQFQPSQVSFNGGVGMLPPPQMTWIKADGIWLQTISFGINLTAHIF